MSIDLSCLQAGQHIFVAGSSNEPTGLLEGGEVSRIVPKVDVVTALRTDVDIVVTEFGVAELRGRDLGERVRAMAAIAAPEFRDELVACR
ncbi:MAG: acetyl-CoA hydrolase/transferase C-terminal domain-containing protein [Pseudomonadales bacterium]